MKTFILSILLLITTLLSAQNFRLGFQTSPHLSWINSRNGDIDNDDIRLGLRYGLDADIYLSGLPRYTINTGLFVANHSFKAQYTTSQTFFINGKEFNEPVNILYKTNYIEVPINIKLRSDMFYRMTFYGQFGLSNLFNISASATSSDKQLDGDAVTNGILNRHIRLYNLNMIMGGGMEYDVGSNTAINVGIQYSNGLTDVTDIGSLNEKTVFNSLRLIIGVMF
ncbi:MAG: outer membrane beta-barrel protein [Prolixibacteraceae bacterium]|jgi:hypothetical protein|nr:outer membrane beta-barrel protein [Prolixibacteraceae bacterium]